MKGLARKESSRPIAAADECTFGGDVIEAVAGETMDELGLPLVLHGANNFAARSLPFAPGVSAPESAGDLPILRIMRDELDPDSEHRALEGSVEVCSSVRGIETADAEAGGDPSFAA